MSTILIPLSEDFFYWDPETIAWYPHTAPGADADEEEGAEP